MGSVIVVCGFSGFAAGGILVPGPGIEPVFPALQGGCPGPPGQSWCHAVDSCGFAVLSTVPEGYTSCWVLSPQDCFGISGSFVVPRQF